jgi:hypothetical protein
VFQLKCINVIYPKLAAVAIRRYPEFACAGQNGNAGDFLRDGKIDDAGADEGSRVEEEDGGVGVIGATGVLLDGNIESVFEIVAIANVVEAGEALERLIVHADDVPGCVVGALQNAVGVEEIVDGTVGGIALVTTSVGRLGLVEKEVGCQDGGAADETQQHENDNGAEREHRTSI